jgi:hypothetical protein
MKTKKWLLAVAALFVAASLTYTPAFTQDAAGTKAAATKTSGKKASGTGKEYYDKPARNATKVDREGKTLSPYSLAERTAASRMDCKPNALKKDGMGIHGHYRTYGQWDPELKSIEGRKQFEACVKRGLDPTPWFAFGQRMMIGSGDGKFFGRGKNDCLRCHSSY